jgi:magnesium chelatase accessory protein
MPEPTPPVPALPAAPEHWAAWREHWPNGAASAVVTVGGRRWHVQRAGRGPVLLLIHGTAGATHAWRDVLPALARRYTVVAPDLPGHGFTEAPSAERITLAGMAADTAALLRALDVRPVGVVGHSAGAAVLMQMHMDGALPDARLLVGLNAAIVPPPALYRALAGPWLTGVFGGATLARLVSGWAGRPDVVRTMLDGTGSRLDDHFVRLYAALVASPRHVQTALTMMAQWDLAPLLRDVWRLTVPTRFLAGANDRWVPAAQARQVAHYVPAARLELVERYGHLMHEEAGHDTAERLLQAFEEAGVGGVGRDGDGSAGAHHAQPDGLRGGREAPPA